MIWIWLLVTTQTEGQLLEAAPQATRAVLGDASSVSAQTAITHPTHPFYALETDDPRYWDAATDRVIVGFKPGVDPMKKVSWLESLGAQFLRKSRSRAGNFVVMKLPGKSKKLIRSYIRAVKDDPDVLYAEPDLLYKALAIFEPNDPMYPDQWGLANINARSAWSFTTGGTDVTICIIDQGVQYDHPDLSAHFIGYVGYDFADDDSDPYPDRTSEDHATHCAGVAAAVINNGTGIAGVSNSRLVSFRVLNELGYGNLSDIADAINAAGDSAYDVVSMSLGGAYSSAIETACQYAWSQGCILVAAAGNDGNYDDIDYPGAFPTVIAVGALDHYNVRASFSDYGPGLELMAPGVNILSTVNPNSYDSVNWSGTSMATPHVSGVAALVKHWNPSLTNAQIRAILDSTAADLYMPGWDDTSGYGQVNPYLALKMADGLTYYPDTLPGPPDYFQPPLYVFSTDYQVEYEFTKVQTDTAAGDAGDIQVVEAWFAFYNYDTLNQRSKDVYLYIAEDNNGLPGNIVWQDTITVTLNPRQGQWFVVDLSALNITFPKGSKFWVGHYEPDTGAPSSLIDVYANNPANAWSTDGSTWNLEFYDYLQFVVVQEPGSSGEREVARPFPAALKVLPTVSKGSFTVMAFVPQPGPLSVSLYDASGRRVKVLWRGEAQLGGFSLRASAEDLAPGTYFVVMKGRSFTWRARLIKVR